MSGVHRFLSRREKKRDTSTQRRPQNEQRVTTRSRPDHFGGIFTLDEAPLAKPSKEHGRRVAGILERLRHYGIGNIVESNIEYALRACDGDSDAAFRMLILLEDTYEGLLKPFNPRVKMLGAVNKEGVTCYLDSLLFAMFARLESFEAMLYENFEDVKRRRLAGILRLWVNMLRTGRLITTDITMHLQQALSDCGWEAAGRCQQQDPSEAFTFITGQLELPLLTLKMDLYHTGKEDPNSDHKFVNERILEVAIPDTPRDSSKILTLEDCLEHYFNNRIEVKRHMENQRRNTLNPPTSDSQPEKPHNVHIEVAEVASDRYRSDSPMVESPMSEDIRHFESSSADVSRIPVDKLRPSSGRKRTESIFSQRRIDFFNETTKSDAVNEYPLDVKGRKMSTRTEVLMPAWQFFKLLPWYTDNMPTSDAQVAAHFARTRPVLGICLKRYSYSLSGEATRLGDHIDIPLEIAVPNFVSDENMDEDGPLAGNFRLLLQSVVCHRGNSVTSGHYITLCRGSSSAFAQNGAPSESSDSDEEPDQWMRFDDISQPRVTYVDIHDALKQETPYLLFYQVQPIDDDGRSIHDLPSYAEATSRSHSDVTTSEKPYLNGMNGSETVLVETASNQTSHPGVIDWATESDRPSLDVPRDSRRGRSSTDGRRRSIAFDEPIAPSSASSTGGSTVAGAASIPTTPSEEKGLSFLSVANKISSRRTSRMSKGSTSRSRPTSTGPHGNGKEDGSATRFSLNMSRLTQRMTKSDPNPPNPEPIIGIKSEDLNESSSPTYTSRNSSDAAFEQSNGAVKPLATDETEAGKPREVAEKRISFDTSRKNPSKEGIVGGKPSKKKEKERSRRVRSNKSAEDRDCIVM